MEQAGKFSKGAVTVVEWREALACVTRLEQLVPGTWRPAQTFLDQMKQACSTEVQKRMAEIDGRQQRMFS